jgi:hypothetical protein
MCDLTNDYTLEEVLYHPKLTDDYKFNFIQDLVDEQQFIDWFETLDNLGISIDDLGLTIDILDNVDYIWDIDDMDLTPSQTFSQENFSVINLYRYISTQYGPSNIGPNTRPFCKMLVSRTNSSLMRKEDIERLNSSNPGFGKGGSNTYSVFNWRGGVNCRHIWVKYKYDTQSMNLVKAPLDQQPSNIQVDNRVPYANGTNYPTPK